MNHYLKNNKILHIIFLVSFILIILFAILKINSLLFISCSIFANILLIEIIKCIIDKLQIKISNKEKLFLLIIILLIYSFYLYSILTRKFIYYWDFSCYYDIQMKSIETFKKGLFEGIRFFVGSTWSGEYGSFITFFPHIIFHFTNKSINSYIISCVFTIIPYIFISLTLLLKTIEKYLKETNKDKNSIFYLGILCFSLFPLLHGVLLLGQPDLFGLTFILLIICLTLKYDFKQIEIDRLILLFLLTFMLTICRRWYIYWIITYYIIYIINIILINLKNKKDLIKIIKNIVIYGIIVLSLFLITLYPFIKNTLLNNYSSSYSFYSYGGALIEITNQINHLGILSLLIILGGYLYGIINKNYQRYTISLLVQYLLIIVLFTKIQNMGLHHSLLLLFSYFYGIYMFIICLMNNPKKIKRLLVPLTILIIISNFIFSYINLNSILFSDVKLKIQDEENYDSIKEITSFLEKKLDENNTGYLITHNNSINPDKLRNFKTPTSIIKKYVPYGSAVIGVHKFPLELFSAKYIMTTNPFESISVEEKYNKIFNELVIKEKFKIIKKVELKNNISFEIYERIEPVTEEEKNMYLDILKEESKKYKNLYEDIINSYVIE